MPKSFIKAGRAFDAGLAAFAAVSAGFVAFAMPDPLFAGLVEASRLAEVVPAARPPLGDTARSGAVAAASLLAFASVWTLMALLGRPPSRREAEPAAEVVAPRQRRADAHPDAPPRPPLLARDLGEPLEAGEPLELDEVAPEAPEARPSIEAAHRPLPGFLVPQARDPEPEAAAEAGPPDAEPEPGPDAQLEPEAEAVPIAELAARLPQVDEFEEEQEDSGSASLSHLVNRIETGLSRKRQALPVAGLPPVDAPSDDEEKVGHRLRSAINDLQKIASSGA